MVIVLVVMGTIFFMKNSFSGGPKPINIDTGKIDVKSEDNSEQIVSGVDKDTGDGLIIESSNLDSIIHLKCRKNQKVSDILDEISERYSIEFKYNKDDMIEEIDITMDIKGISVGEALEILLGNNKYFWYDKSTEIVIMRKL